MFRAPDPVNEPNRTYAPGTPERARAARRARRSSAAGTSTSPRSSAGSASRRRTPSPWSSRTRTRTSSRASRAAAPPRSSARSPQRTRRTREWSNASWQERAGVFLRAAELLAGPWRARLNAATMLGQSKTRAPGGDRRGLRADRLLALQRRLRGAHLRRAAALAGRHAQRARLPPARGLRLRRHAVQLHGDRRQPADERGAHGQHRPLEARLDRGASPRTS